MTCEEQSALLAEVERLRERNRKLARDKALNQLILRLIERLNPLPGLEDMVREMLSAIVECIGGTNIKMYYWMGEELHCQGFQGDDRRLEAIDDPDVARVRETRALAVERGGAEDALLRGGVLRGSFTWTFPLLVGQELVGIVKVENVHVHGEALGTYLPTLFSHAALILRHEVRNAAQRRSEAELRAATERLRLAVEAGLIGIWDWDVEHDELRWDASMYRLYGRREGDFGGAYQAWISAVHPDDRARTEREIQAALRAEREHGLEFRVLWPDGSIHHLQAAFRTLRDASGRPLRMVGINYDLTERLRAQEEIRELTQTLEHRVAERTAQLEAANRELEAFAYSVSHDLRAPLRAIDGYRGLLQHRAAGQLDAQSERYLTNISHAAKRMGQLIDDLLSFSRMGRVELAHQRVDLGALARDVIRDLEPEAAGRGVVWRIGELPAVTGDRAMLRVVLVNLLSNALKFTRHREAAEIQVGWRPVEDGEAAFFVRDNGVGFDMAYADKLFGVFQRLHRAEEFEGTGIGLASVRRIVTRHGGRTWAEGALGGGATIYFTLPVSQRASLAAQP
jgi:PAS domain S-box-containing protein